jgi:transposase
MRSSSPVADHLTLEELERRFRACRDARERSHFQVVFLRKKGWETSMVAEVCGYKPDWVRQLIRRYNKLGPDSLGDRRENNGKEPLLSEDLMRELHDAVVSSEPSSGGLWTGPKVAQWMSGKLGRHVSPQLAWDYLQRLRLSKQTPRPRHSAATAEEQDRFKKNSEAGWR